MRNGRRFGDLLNYVIGRLPDDDSSIDAAVGDCNTYPRIVAQLLARQFLRCPQRFLRAIAQRLV